MSDQSPSLAAPIMRVYAARPNGRRYPFSGQSGDHGRLRRTAPARREVPAITYQTSQRF